MKYKDILSRTWNYKKDVYSLKRETCRFADNINIVIVSSQIIVQKDSGVRLSDIWLSIIFHRIVYFIIFYILFNH